jgi:hypothetical protein
VERVALVIQRVAAVQGVMLEQVAQERRAVLFLAQVVQQGQVVAQAVVDLVVIKTLGAS